MVGKNLSYLQSKYAKVRHLTPKSVTCESSRFWDFAAIVGSSMFKYAQFWISQGGKRESSDGSCFIFPPRRHYRRLARDIHPDKHPDNVEEATRRWEAQPYTGILCQIMLKKGA